MPVTLISDTERMKWEDTVTETHLIYRRPTSAKQREIRAKHTEMGLTNEGEYLEEMIEWAVLDWSEGFKDEDGNPLKFQTGMTRNLPDTYKARFLLALYEDDPIREQMGN